MPVEELMGQLAHRASEIIDSQKRLRALLSANRSIVAELSLSELGQRIVEAARETANARHAALGVLGADGSIDSLLHSGTDDEPAGGVGLDPRFAGLLEGRPRPKGFLGLPIRAGGSVYAHLYLTGPEGGEDFTEQDEQFLASLAATAGIAIENARLYEESRRRQEWLLASSEVSQRLMSLTERQEEDEIWRLIAGTVRQLADADVVSLILPDDDDPGRLHVKIAAGNGRHLLEGLRYDRAGSVAARVMDGGERVVLTTGAEGSIRDLRQPAGHPGPTMVLPLRGEIGSRGVLAVARRRGQVPFTAADVDMAEDFAGQAAIATELAAARSAQQRLAGLEERERIARDLHDHVIQRLFATGLTLQSTAGSSASAMVRERLTHTVQELDETIRQIRTSIFALKYSRPMVSSIRATVLTVVDDAAPTMGFRPATHLVGPLDTLADESLVADVAAVLQEALTNIVQHARARSASVTVAAASGWLTVVVVDDGRGLPVDAPLSGLVNLRHLAESRSGAMTVDEAEGGGTRLTWSIPLT